jgi:curved DNA-binding protein CbpA
MKAPAADSIDIDPFDFLGLPEDAGMEVVRSRYLELVKKFPPDREPDKFRQLQAAYEAARDPLVLARRLLRLSSPDEPPSWQSVIDRQANQPPNMTVDFLLSLGNRPSDYRPAGANAGNDTNDE